VRLLFTFLCISLYLTGFGYAQAPKPVLTIAADEWCPINCKAGAERPGVGIDLAKRVFEPAGYEIKYVVMPWSQALKEVRAGKVDAVIGAAHADDPHLIFPDSSIYPMGDDFFVVKGNPWRYQGIHTLKGKRIGIIQDYGYSKEIKRFIADNQTLVGVLQAAKSSEPAQENLEKLLSGKIDVMIEARPIMEYTLYTMHKQEKVVWAGGMPQEGVYLAFSPVLAQSKERALLYDATIRALRNAQKLDEIYKPYGLRAP
jgi:polar amino acid transport system substrate-binding protein